MTSAAPPALELRGLGKVFRVPHAPASTDPRRERHSRRSDHFWALREIDLTISTGQTLGIIGHNGSGKSTLLKILAGVMSADRGTFTAHGRIGALLELGAGFHPDLTGLENVYLNGALPGLTVREVDRVLPAIIEFAELERFMDMPVRHYSSGMQARLGFAVATRLNPDILLMDETFATGDARFQARALAHVSGMRGQGRTLLLVSHSIELLMDLTDQVAWLEAGRLRALGPPREVLSEYRRTQHSALAAEYRRGQTGLVGIFEPVSAAPQLCITTAEWRAPALHIRLACTSPLSTGELVLETAWMRLSDGRVLLESSTPLRLPAGHPPQITVQFTPALDPLITADWHVLIALRYPGAAEWLARHEVIHTIATTATERAIPTLAHSRATWSHFSA